MLEVDFKPNLTPQNHKIDLLRSESYL